MSMLLDYERPEKYIVTDTAYLESGTPVLTANKSFILGYTNETHGIYSAVPVIIFDDFTTDKKYVDFPFKVKSSAIKILYPKADDSLTLIFELMYGIKFDPKEHKRYYISEYQNLEIALPDRPEQQKIADCLTSLDEVIAAQGRKVEALKAHKRGLMQQLFPREGETRPGLRFPEFRNAPEWEIKPLLGVAENLDNKRIPITEGERTKGEVPYYGASGIVDYVEGYLFDENLLCVSEDGANLVARTYPIAFPISGKTWVNNHAHVLRFEDLATQKMVEDYLNSTDLREFITGVAQPKLNRSMLDAIPVPLPEPDERYRIADCLSSLDTQITAESNQLSALKTHKQGLMQQLFPAPESGL